MPGVTGCSVADTGEDDRFRRKFSFGSICAVIVLSTATAIHEGTRPWPSVSREPIFPQRSFSWGSGGIWPLP